MVESVNHDPNLGVATAAGGAVAEPPHETGTAVHSATPNEAMNRTMSCSGGSINRLTTEGEGDPEAAAVDLVVSQRFLRLRNHPLVEVVVVEGKIQRSFNFNSCQYFLNFIENNLVY